jgi:hypothetical protein
MILLVGGFCRALEVIVGGYREKIYRWIESIIELSGWVFEILTGVPPFDRVEYLCSWAPVPLSLSHFCRYRALASGYIHTRVSAEVLVHLL